MLRLLGDVRRRETQRRRLRGSASLNFFVDVTLVRTRGRCRRGNSKGDIAETATPLNYCASIGLRRSRKKTVAEHTRGDGPKAVLSWTVSRMFAFLPPGGQFRRTNNRAGPANAGAHPISPPSSASSSRGRSIPTERKQRSVCPDRLVAQTYRHH